VFFVVTERIGTRGFLDARSIVDLAARGHAIGSHTATHPSYMRRLDAAALEHEWKASRDTLGELLGAAPALAAVPGGSVSRPVMDAAAAAGYAILFTSTPTARVRTFGEMQVVGRCTIWASDPPGLAADYLSGAAGPRRRRRLGWELKSAAKRVNPRVYEGLRRAKATSA
jgi:peptidoglycan/xylan/chitin deacetylase (PgdA/CDA1 family)